jgi:predicted GNAT family acetyltransferase
MGSVRRSVRPSRVPLVAEAPMEQTHTEAPELEIRREEDGRVGAFFVEVDGRRLAELRYTRSSPQTVVLEHTEVSDVLQGRGVGRKLVEAAVAWARRTGTSFVPVCSYAKTVFERYPGLRDVLR